MPKVARNSRFLMWIRCFWHLLRLHPISVNRGPYSGWHCAKCMCGESMFS